MATWLRIRLLEEAGGEPRELLPVGNISSSEISSASPTRAASSTLPTGRSPLLSVLEAQPAHLGMAGLEMCRLPIEEG